MRAVFIHGRDLRERGILPEQSYKSFLKNKYPLSKALLTTTLRNYIRCHRSSGHNGDDMTEDSGGRPEELLLEVVVQTKISHRLNGIGTIILSQNQLNFLNFVSFVDQQACRGQHSII